jgi:glycosyltransferase involved in cell wall biosynthesis
MLSYRLQTLDPDNNARDGSPGAPVARAAARNMPYSWLRNLALRFAPPVGRRAGHGVHQRADPASTTARKAISKDEEQANPRIFIDLTDVLCHAIWHETCAGIPRVQLEVASRLFRSIPSVAILGFHQKGWRELGALIEEADGDVDKTFALLKETFSDFKIGLKGLKLLWRRRRRHLKIPRYGRIPEIRTQDCLFIGGAFWTNGKIIELCNRAAANGANLVVLVHDLIPLVQPSFTGHDFAQEYRDVLRLPAHFIVTTELSRSELKRARRSIGANARTSSTVLPLADEFPGSKRDEKPGFPSTRLKTLAGQDFALCVGTIEIRKNHHALLGVWDDLAAERGASMPKLVIAGRRGWKAYATLAQLDALDQGSAIVFIEAPTDDELRWLYASCLFTVFPSFFEGWGLPVGESFWFGKACAASNASSIAPVARDLCALFSPYHRDDMKNAIGRLLNSEARKAFERRIAAAPLRTWSEFSADIEKLIAERRPLSDAVPEQSETERQSPAARLDLEIFLAQSALEERARPPAENYASLAFMKAPADASAARPASS